MNKLSKNQSGMVSLIVTMVLMVIMSLIVLGFARISRHEQRQALDRQLSAQAFYAAESGINDAIKALNSGTQYLGYDGDAGTGNKTHCGPDTDPASLYLGPVPSGTPATNVVDAVTNTVYTCLLINQNPTSLVYNPVGEGQAISADLHFSRLGVPIATVDHIEIEWSAPTPGPSFIPPPYPRFPPIGGWPSDAALLRMSMTNFNNIDNDYNRDLLNNSTFTAFLYPRQIGPGSIDFDNAPAAQGAIAEAKCNNATDICSIIIDNIDSVHVYLRIGSLYKDSQITIKAWGRNFGVDVPLNIIGGQAVIDSTGKSQDVLRRIQVRLPINSKSGPMNYAVQVLDGLCKNFAIGSGFGQDYAPPPCDISPP